MNQRLLLKHTLLFDRACALVVLCTPVCDTADTLSESRLDFETLVKLLDVHRVRLNCVRSRPPHLGPRVQTREVVGRSLGERKHALRSDNEGIRSTNDASSVRSGSIFQMTFRTLLRYATVTPLCRADSALAQAVSRHQRLLCALLLRARPDLVQDLATRSDLVLAPAMSRMHAFGCQSVGPNAQIKSVFTQQMQCRPCAMHTQTNLLCRRVVGNSCPNLELLATQAALPAPGCPAPP